MWKPWAACPHRPGAGQAPAGHPASTVLGTVSATTGHVLRVLPGAPPQPPRRRGAWHRASSSSLGRPGVQGEGPRPAPGPSGLPGPTAGTVSGRRGAGLGLQAGAGGGGRSSCPHSPRPRRLEVFMEAEASQEVGAQRGFAGRSGPGRAGKPSWKMWTRRRGAGEWGLCARRPHPSHAAPPGSTQPPLRPATWSLPETRSSGRAVWLGREAPGTPEVASPGPWEWSQVSRPCPGVPERWGVSRGRQPSRSHVEPQLQPPRTCEKSGEKSSRSTKRVLA